MGADLRSKRIMPKTQNILTGGAAGHRMGDQQRQRSPELPTDGLDATQVRDVLNPLRPSAVAPAEKPLLLYVYRNDKLQPQTASS